MGFPVLLLTHGFKRFSAGASGHCMLSTRRRSLVSAACISKWTRFPLPASFFYFIKQWTSSLTRFWERTKLIIHPGLVSGLILSEQPVGFLNPAPERCWTLSHLVWSEAVLQLLCSTSDHGPPVTETPAFWLKKNLHVLVLHMLTYMGFEVSRTVEKTPSLSLIPTIYFLL